MTVISGHFVDVFNEQIYPAKVIIDNGRIISVNQLSADAIKQDAYFILPGFVDSHVHIESSMLVPAEFARLALPHGTVATVSDPHEIANVCGIDGVDFMIQNGNTVPLKFNFGAPSCVPATIFETAGASLNAADIERLLQKDEIKYLSEMMNFPGVLHQDEEVMKKIAAAIAVNKPIDGHAPGLRGNDAKTYIGAGISTDHECFTKEEALEKLSFGMKILIREGSAAKNFEALIELLHDYPNQMMFCSDDKHPDSLVEGHINQLCKRAIASGIPLFNVLKAACINPVLHYKLDVGLLRTGDEADFILVKDLEKFEVFQTYIKGELVAEKGRSIFNDATDQKNAPINNFSCLPKTPSDFAFPASNVSSDARSILFPVIEACDGQLITNKLHCPIPIQNGLLNTDTSTDILKIVVVNRYKNAPVAKGFIKNFGLKQGALASSVAHDSHNIVAVGVDDESICEAVNLIIKHEGGVSCYPGKSTGATIQSTGMILALPVGGLMSQQNGYEVAREYAAIDQAAKLLGSILTAPFMTLSFMALLVIPHLKISDLGLFDGDRFELMP